MSSLCSSDEEEGSSQASDESNQDDDYGTFALDSAGGDAIVKQIPFVILNEEDMQRKQSEAIAAVTAVLGLTPGEAALLLRHYKWSLARLHECWFQDESKVRALVGLQQQRDPADPLDPVDPVSERSRCDICFDEHPTAAMPHCGCSHRFCAECWGGYCSTATMEGPGVLSLRCPSPQCGAAASEELVRPMLSEALRAKYDAFLLRSFVEGNLRVRWCPCAGCPRAVECCAGGGGGDVRCLCGGTFCWGCREEAHRPVDCETVRQWLIKNSAESENMNWILANTKPCPKCARPIEKNQGCMHITCQAPCKYEFCWLCLGAWKDHGERTGGFYACNRYEAAKATGVLEDSEKRRQNARSSLERYMHYYERWAAHGAAHKKAKADLAQLTEQKLNRLGDLQNTPASQLKFVTEAIAQICECRRVLKWTYAFGFYNMIDEDNKKRFFEYTQGEAEQQLERLSKAVEGSEPQDLPHFLTVAAPAREFSEFRGRLAGLTAVTKRFFEKLVVAVEEGLPAVDAESPPRALSFDSTGGGAGERDAGAAGTTGAAAGAGSGSGDARGGDGGGGGWGTRGGGGGQGLIRGLRAVAGIRGPQLDPTSRD